MKYLIIAVLLLKSTIAISQCDKVYAADSGFPPVPGYTEVVVTNYTECGYSYEYIVDINTRTIPDQFTVYEIVDSQYVELFKSGWIGDTAYWPFAVAIPGYFQIEDGVVTHAYSSCFNIPPNFFFYRPSYCSGLGRIIFHSAAKQVAVRVDLNETTSSYVEFVIHCGDFMKPIEVIRITEYVCHYPVREHATAHSNDCLKQFDIDSIYVGNFGGKYDTLYLLSGRIHKIEPLRNFKWEDGSIQPLYEFIDRDILLEGYIKTEWGCEVPAGIYIIAYTLDVYIPNIFSPNGDGVNDSFEAYSYGETTILDIQIYNRSGALVYQGTKWVGDGSEAGTYVYLVTVRSKGVIEVIAGDITVIR